MVRKRHTSAQDAFVPVRSKKSSRLERTSSLIEPLLKRLGIASGVRLSRIRADWDGIFEKPLTLHTWPSKLSEGTLLLNVDSPIWIHQLGYHKGAILSKLSCYGVKDIRFRVGRVVCRQMTEAPPAAPELSQEEVSFISELVSGFGEGELKQAIHCAVERSMRAEKKRTGNKDS